MPYATDSRFIPVFNFSRLSCFTWLFHLFLAAVLMQFPLSLPVYAGALSNLDIGGPVMTLTLTSTAFAHEGSIPAVYTCDGRDTSPPLSWRGIPGNAKSLVLIVDDPDAPDPKAPKMTWVHWILYNIPPDVEGLREGLPEKDLPAGSLGGLNDWKRTGYGGPCPPIGRHRYFHKLYALDTVLPDLNKPTKAALEKAMQGHIVAKAELIGTYKRP